MSQYFDREGNPLGLFEWAALYEDHSYRIIAQNRIEDILVSTIWLGLDHSWGWGGPPLIFETMILGLGAGEDLDIDEYQWRWSTEVQALAGHDQAVAKVREVLVRREC